MVCEWQLLIGQYCFPLLGKGILFRSQIKSLLDDNFMVWYIMAAYAWTKDCHCLTLSSYFFTHLLEIGDRAQILHLNICQFIAAWRSKSATASSFLIGAGYRVQWLDVMMSKFSNWMQGRWWQMYGWELHNEAFQRVTCLDNLRALGTISRNIGAPTKSGCCQ